MTLSLLTACAAPAAPGENLGIEPFSHAPDYTWVAGELYRSELEGGFWGIRFSKADPPLDSHQGRFVLGNDPRLAAFKPGDLVLIRGKIADNQITIWMAGTLYEIHDIRPL